MKIITSTELDSSISDLTKNTVSTIETVFFGLKPSTTHTLTLNGVDVSFLTKPWGGDLGDPLVSDSEGQLKLTVLYEAVDSEQDFDALQFNTDKSIGEQRKPNNFRQSALTLSLTDGTTSYNKLIMLGRLIST